MSHPSGVTGTPTSLRTFDRGLKVLVYLCFIGFVIGLGLNLVHDDILFLERKGTITHYLFRNHDTIWFGLCTAFTLLLLWAARSGRLSIADRLWPPVAFDPVPAIAALVFAFAAAGTYLIYHGYGLSLDEFMAGFQAAIFREGRLLAPLPTEWKDFAKPLQPIFAFHDPAHGLWGSHYRPVAAAIRALFSLISLGTLTNAVLTAASVVLVAAIARRLWPEQREAALLAAVLLASSPQVLITGMTPYAMPAHLFLNLLWLWLFLRDDRLGHLLAPWVGVAAVGLHQVHNHALFVLPFMLALLFSKRWRLALYYGAIYTVGHLLWIFWHDLAVWVTLSGVRAETGAGAGVAYLAQATARFELPSLNDISLMTVNLLRLVGWQNPVFLPLAFVALRRWPDAPPVVRQLAWGLVLSMVPSLLILSNQMHGWGFRFLHGLLGNMMLIAAYGWIQITTADRSGTATAEIRRLITAFTAVTILIAVPLRAFQVEQFVRPFAESTGYIESLPQEVALIDFPAIWFGEDLVRNDPYLRNTPKVVALHLLSPEQLRHLCDRYTVTVVTQADLAGFGIKRSPRSVLQAVREAGGTPALAAADAAGTSATSNSDKLRSILESPRCQP